MCRRTIPLHTYISLRILLIDSSTMLVVLLSTESTSVWRSFKTNFALTTSYCRSGLGVARESPSTTAGGGTNKSVGDP